MSAPSDFERGLARGEEITRELDDKFWAAEVESIASSWIKASRMEPRNEFHEGLNKGIELVCESLNSLLSRRALRAIA